MRTKKVAEQEPARLVFMLKTDAANVIERRRIDGVRRYAAGRSWRIGIVSPADSAPEAVRALLRREKPFGCIVEASTGCEEFPPAFFGGVRVCYLEPHGNKAPWRGVSAVVADNDAVAEAAFRELSGTLPVSYGVVPSSTQRDWSIARVRAFRRLARAEGKPCRVFPVAKGEPDEARAARMAAWIAALPRGCAVFAVTDRLAAIAAEAARAAGRALPREIALVGADGRYEAPGRPEPAVSTINIDFERAGFLAAQALDRPGGAIYRFGPMLVARRASTRGRGRREPMIRDAVEVIRREACDGLTAAALAARFPGCRNLFERRFREAMGHSVLDEILQVRLEKVFALLANTDIPVSAVSDFCGFGDGSDLRKLFRARTGVSMRQWRADRRSGK